MDGFIMNKYDEMIWGYPYFRKPPDVHITHTLLKPQKYRVPACIFDPVGSSVATVFSTSKVSMENPKGSNFTSGGTTSIVSRKRFSQVERLDLVGLCWTVGSWVMLSPPDGHRFRAKPPWSWNSPGPGNHLHSASASSVIFTAGAPPVAFVWGREPTQVRGWFQPNCKILACRGSRIVIMNWINWIMNPLRSIECRRCPPKNHEHLLKRTRDPNGKSH